MNEEDDHMPRMYSPEVQAAMAKKLEAETTRVHTQNRREVTQLEIETIRLDKLREEDEARKLSDYHQRVYWFDGEVSPLTVDSCLTTLNEWDRVDVERGNPTSQFTIIFSSPGGDVISGMALFDFIAEMRRKGHRVVTKALGMAASMAGILLQAGDHRIMSAESWLLIHEGSFGAFGSYAEVEDRVEWVKAIGARILNIFAERAVPEDAPNRAAKVAAKRKSIKAKYTRKDWWLSSDDALKLGFIDEVA